MIPMSLLLHFLGLSLAYLLSLGHFYYFADLWTIIPTILAQWSLLCCSLPLSLLYCWVSSTIETFCQKMGINTHYSSMTQEVMPKDLAYPITHSSFSLRFSPSPHANPELPIAYLSVLSFSHTTRGLFQPRLIQSYNIYYFFM